jgi:hypothetical protein
MAKTIDISAGDDLFFEYRKYLAEGEPHKHRHSMIAVKRFDLDYDGGLRKHIANLGYAHLLMMKVDLHQDNKELELHWLDEQELAEMYLTQYDPQTPIQIKNRWKLSNAKPLALSQIPSPDNPDLKEYSIVLVHGGFEPTFDHLAPPGLPRVAVIP